MLGNIIEITENNVIVNLNSNVSNINNLINNYVIIQDKKQIIGEIIGLKQNNLIIELLGEIIDNEFSFGITKKPVSMLRYGYLKKRMFLSLLVIMNRKLKAYF